MTCEEFIDKLPPEMEAAAEQGDKWCIVYFSKEQDGYRQSFNLDFGDALLIVDALIKRYGIKPDVLAEMQ